MEVPFQFRLLPVPGSKTQGRQKKTLASLEEVIVTLPFLSHFSDLVMYKHDKVTKHKPICWSFACLPWQAGQKTSHLIKPSRYQHDKGKAKTCSLQSHFTTPLVLPYCPVAPALWIHQGPIVTPLLDCTFLQIRSWWLSSLRCPVSTRGPLHNSACQELNEIIVAWTSLNKDTPSLVGERDRWDSLGQGDARTWRNWTPCSGRPTGWPAAWTPTARWRWN